MSKLGDLPINVVQRLCSYLNLEGAGVRNWKDLIALAPGGTYDALSYDAFARSGMRPYTSAADQVLTDFISRGVSVDELYDMLGEMEARACMSTLEPYVSSALLGKWRRNGDYGNLQQDPPLSLQGYGGVADEHPLDGPLPSSPTPLPISTSIKYPPDNHLCDSRTVLHGSGIEMLPPISHGNLPSPPPPPPYHNGDQFTEYTPPPHYHGSIQSHPSESNYDGVRQPDPIAHGYHGEVGCVPHPGHGDSTTNEASSMSPYPSISSDKHIDYPPSAIPDQRSGYNPSDQGASYSVAPTPAKIGVDREGLSNILHFSYAELSEATGGFTQDMVGIGTFGTVFKTRVRGNGPYAVKKLHSESEMEEHCVLYDTFNRETFMQELQMLTRYHHRNILSLVAYSNDGHLPCLVYEYMEHGSLSECLQGKRGVCLLWEERVHIAKQVAEALHFLHTVNAPTALVHGDVKSANILLDVNFVPKLCDFGLARELSRPGGRSRTLSTRSTVVRGTLAYMAPEFVSNNKLTTRTDVYAYGVVLLELHTGLPAFSEDQSMQERVLTECLFQLLDDLEAHKQEIITVADARAGWPSNIALALFVIISVCVQKKGRQRPSIEEVLNQLLILPRP